MRLILFALCTMALLCRCGRQEEPHANIHYYLTTTADSSFDQLTFLFEYTRAHRHNEIRSVYLDPVWAKFDLNRPQTVYLGASTIETEPIKGYDFGLANAQIVKGKDTIPLKSQITFNDFSAFALLPSAQQEIHLTFLLDVDASVVMDSAGHDWMKPKFIIEM